MAVIPSFKKHILDLGLAEGTLKVMILNPTHTTDTAAQIFIDDVSANELSAGGDYTAGGEALASITTNISGTGVTLDFADLALTGIDSASQGDVHAFAIYVDTGTPATSRIIDIQTLGTDKTLISTDTYTIIVDASGLITID